MRRAARWAAGAIAIAFGLGVLARRAGAFPMRVEGPSMLPTLAAGDLVAVTRAPHSGPRQADLVVVRDATGREVVKRVARVVGAEGYWLEGDNPAASTDSRTYGAVSRDQIVGVVRARYWPPARVRLFTSRP